MPAHDLDLRRMQAATPATVYEVLVAYNLDPPYRWSQSYGWIDVVADSPSQALDAARALVVARREEGDDVEETGYLRAGGAHLTSAGRGSGDSNAAIGVRWDMAVPAGREGGTVVREPVYGLRIGFIADAQTVAEHLSEQEAREFALVVAKPISGAKPVCLCPWVFHG